MAQTVVVGSIQFGPAELMQGLEARKVLLAADGKSVGLDARVFKFGKERTGVITTDVIDPLVAEYAATFYEKTDGTEIAILDCIGFLRHFLHLFHRIRADYLNAYQTLVLNEPDSAVSQTLKEAFLALRQAAESGE